jgi:hypothetical protein
MVEIDARSFIARLLAAGIVPREKEASSEIALIVEVVGFVYPCDWLQIGLFDGRPTAWLAGSDRGKLAITRWEFESTSLPQRVSQQDLRDFYEFLGIKGKVEVYRHKTTREFMYVGRPFHAMPDRKWWQFLETPVESSSEGGFEEGRGFGAFDAAAEGVEHTAVHLAVHSSFIEAEPVGEMQIDGFANDFEMRSAQFEETFEENDAQNFFAGEFFRLKGSQLGAEAVSCVNGDETVVFGNSGKLKEIERSLDGVECEKA